MLPATLVSQLLLLAVPSVVYAQSCSSTTARTCSTRLAAVPNWWPVATYVRSTSLKAITTTDNPLISVTQTVPGVPLTATVVATVVETSTTTAAPTTDTVSVTSTVYATTSETSTSTTTGIVTATELTTATSILTSTVPIPTNFMNAYDSSGDSTYAGYKRAIARRRDWAARLAHEKKGNIANWLALLFSARKNQGRYGLTPNKKSIALKQFRNPVAVTCSVTVQKLCATAKPTTTTLTATAAPTTTTTTISSTITSVSTVIPPAITVTVVVDSTTSTLTQVTTVIVGATSTVLETTTTTSVSTTSVYAACATQNLLGPRLQNGGAIDSTYFYDSSAIVVSSPQKSSYDCCVACQTSDYCQFFQYSSATGNCFVTGQDAAWCPNMQQDYNFPSYFTYSDPNTVSDALTVGNGACGMVMDLGATNSK